MRLRAGPGRTPPQSRRRKMPDSLFSSESGRSFSSPEARAAGRGGLPPSAVGHSHDGGTEQRSCGDSCAEKPSVKAVSPSPFPQIFRKKAGLNRGFPVMKHHRKKGIPFSWETRLCPFGPGLSGRYSGCVGGRRSPGARQNLCTGQSAVLRRRRSAKAGGKPVFWGGRAAFAQT